MYTYYLNGTTFDLLKFTWPLNLLELYMYYVKSLNAQIKFD